MRSTERSIGPRRALLRSGLVFGATLLRAQTPDDPTERRMPNGQRQADLILKADYEQNVRDARELTALAKSIELDFDKNDQNVLSIALLKKLDDVDKLTKRIRGRVRR